MAIKVKAIVGSISKNSYNLKIVEFMRKRYADKLEIVPVLLNDVEMFSVDLENDIPENAKKLKESIKDADAVLFAVAEYNYSISGVLKNAIDWLSRGEHELKDKPAFIIGASVSTLGTVRAQMHLREILLNPFVGPKLFNSEVYIASVHQKINERGEITDLGTIDFLDNVVNNFIKFYEQNK